MYQHYRGDYVSKASQSPPYTYTNGHTQPHPHDTLRSPVENDLMTPLTLASSVSVSPLPMPVSSVSVSSVSSVSTPPTPQTHSHPHPHPHPHSHPHPGHHAMTTTLPVHCQWEATHGAHAAGAGAGGGGPGGPTAPGSGPGAPGSDAGFNPYFTSVADVGVYKYDVVA